MNKREITDQITSSARVIAQLDLSRHFADSTTFGGANLSPAKDSIEQVASFCARLGQFKLSLLPEKDLEAIRENLGRVGAAFSAADDLELRVTDNRAENAKLANKLCDDIINAAEQLMLVSKEWIGYLSFLNQTTVEVAEAQRLVAEVKTKIQEEFESLAKLRRQLEDDSSVKGVQKHNTQFNNHAGELEKSSARWLATSLAFGAATIASVCAAFIWREELLPKGVGNLEIAQFLLSKALVLTVLITAMVWSGKNYKALRHQHYATKHRALALSSFEDFVRGSDDPQVRDAVLLEATRSIFSAGSSGYLEEPSKQSDAISMATELLKAASKLKDVKS